MNLDRFSQGAEDLQDVPRCFLCDDCSSEVYPQDEVCKVDGRVICITCLDNRTEDLDGTATEKADSIGAYTLIASEI